GSPQPGRWSRAFSRRPCAQGRWDLIHSLAVYRMINRHKNSITTAQAALIVTHGNTANRHRPLQGHTIILGRSRGCDLRLEAGDVSDLPCVITRRPDGFHIRDCASRAGTRLNGDAIQDAILQDGDLLQIGSFSFRVELTPGFEFQASETPDAAVSQPQLER